MEKKTRRRKGNDYSKLCDSICRSTQVILQDPQKRVTNKEISSFTGASQTSVSNWLAGKSLPSVEQLYKLSQLFNVSPDWLLEIRQEEVLLNIEKQTYWQALWLFKALISWEIIDVSSIKDPFLHYLVKEAIEIENMPKLSREKADNWYDRVKKDYSIPMLKSYVIFHGYRRICEEFVEINKYDTYLLRMRALQDWQNSLGEYDFINYDASLTEWLEEYLK